VDSFAYAPHGGLLSETFGNSAVHTVSYNTRLQPTQIKLMSGATVLGRKASTNAGSSQVVYDAFGQMIAEYSQGVWTRDYIHRGGEVVATVEASGEVRYLLTDHEGSTRVVMDASSNIVARHDYTAYGEELQAGTGLRTTGQGYGGTDATKQKYGLMERDSETGQDHAWWRKYENTAGRWTSPDPYTGSMSVGDPQSFNRYAYVKNDPVNFVDPSGLEEPEPCPIGEPGCVVTVNQRIPYPWAANDFFNWVSNQNSRDGLRIVGAREPRGSQSHRPDLPDWVLNFYKNHQGQIDRCINKVFGQLWNGTPDIAAMIMERQTIKNAPELDVTVSQGALSVYTGDPAVQGTFSLVSELGNGTAYIASDLYATISQDEKVRTYFHELGNILAAKATGDIKGSHFGDPHGIGKAKDPDTGARLEKCIFKSVPF
jgi:RHS repeat-associated protein